ncbi:MAG TPA: site-2 protease family protein [Thermoanaerobaculia bacterium]|nr:site-2 protease family protein [Thermoanaerobaculia bacterium]
MFGNALTLFRLRGFDVRIDLSWLIIFALIVWSLASGVFPAAYAGLEPWAYWMMGVAAALALFGSIVLHELAHAIVARRYGLRVRSITLFLFGGVADLREEPPSAKAELRTALAGPATSLAIAAVCLAVAVAGNILGLAVPVWTVIGYLGAANLLLFVFNMIPAFPLDGGRVLRSVLWQRTGNLQKATRIASGSGNAFGIFMMILGVALLFAGNFIGGLWWILIGFFIRSAAQTSWNQLLIRQTLSGEPVRKFMKTELVTVPRSLSVRELVEDVVYRTHHKLYPVVERDELVGCVTTNRIKELPREEWDRQTVGAVAETCAPENTIAPETDALEALARMTRGKRSRLLVVDQGRLVGIITLRDLLSFLSIKMELEGSSA